jgi:hypothetical protein
MKKLRLELEQLAVETFHVQDVGDASGTIHGNDPAVAEPVTAGGGYICSWIVGNSCPGQRSCDLTCLYSCPVSCGGPSPTACDSPYCWQRPTTVSVVETEAGG